MKPIFYTLYKLALNLKPRLTCTFKKTSSKTYLQNLQSFDASL